MPSRLRLSEPAVRLLARLSVVFGVPLALVAAFLVVEINRSLQVVRGQVIGLRYLEAAQPLFRSVQIHMGARVSAPAGDEAQRRRLTQLAELDQAFGILERAERERGPTLSTAGRFATVKRHVDELRHELTRPGAVVTDDFREPVLPALRTLMTFAGDASRLVLDDDASSSHLIDAMLFNLPAAQVLVTQIRGHGELITALKRLSAEDRARLDVLERRLDTTQAAITHAVRRSTDVIGDPEVTSRLDVTVKAADDGVTALRRALDRRILNTSEITMATAEWRALGTAALGASFRLWDRSATELHRILARRLDRYWWQQVLVPSLVLVVVAAVAAALLARR